MIGRELRGEHDIWLQSTSPRSYIHFKFKERVVERYPSIAFAIEVKDDDFHGAAEVWFDQDAFDAFRSQFAELARLRTDKLSLSAMGPEEFELQIESIRTDRFLVKYSIYSGNYSSNGLRLLKQLSGEFELDSEYMNLAVEL